MHLTAYYKIINQKFDQAKKLLREAIASSRAMRNDLDAYWAEYNQLCWFSPNDQLLERVLTSKGNFFSLPAMVKPSDSRGNRFSFWHYLNSNRKMFWILKGFLQRKSDIAIFRIIGMWVSENIYVQCNSNIHCKVCMKYPMVVAH